MARIVREAMDAGAVGFAPSGAATHNGYDGNPVPSRLADAWVSTEPALQRPISDATDKSLLGLAQRLADWELLPNGSEGYKKAEVTGGGVDTRDLSSQTMESKQPGLYFIGEVVDVTGWLGGYNFQWAWASGFACAQALAERQAAVTGLRPTPLA